MAVGSPSLAPAAAPPGASLLRRLSHPHHHRSLSVGGPRVDILLDFVAFSHT